MINHPLDYSAPIFVLAEHHIVPLNFRDEPSQSFWSLVQAHVHEDLLDHVVSVEVYWALKDVAIFVELSQHFLLLLDCKYLERSLNDSTPMLVSW